MLNGRVHTPGVDAASLGVLCLPEPVVAFWASCRQFNATEEGQAEACLSSRFTDYFSRTSTFWLYIAPARYLMALSNVTSTPLSFTASPSK
jgi:hypothetical protein